MKIPLNDIRIKPRQRIDLGDIESLAESLKQNGQIQAIGINERKELVWGMRRYSAAKFLNWQEIEVVQRFDLTEEQEQEIEFEEDIRRKDRTWQEKCVAVAKLHRIKSRNARADGESWTMKSMADFTGMGKSSINYMIQIADELATTPKDTGVWNASNYLEAIGLVRDRNMAQATREMESRRAAEPVNIAKFISPPSVVQSLDPTKQEVKMAPLTLRDRANIYNIKFGTVGAKNTPLYYNFQNNEEFITGFWFVGGGNISDLYGSYQVEYLKRIETLFPDKHKVVHLFVGSLPPSDKYIRVGLPQGDSKPDIIADAHELSSHLPFKADLIYADPPYSIEDSQHYANSMVNRDRVISECAASLEPGGFLVWLDHCLPVFKNTELNLVGGIAYIRSTANRFRCISIFRKPICPSTTSTLPITANELNQPLATSPLPPEVSTGQ